ncbi:ADP-ribosylglycohydrolase family protein [Sphingomonas sp. CFBP 13720]|nr:ADP-ribosylglycohydrolase family protein [Sphingomonas sp. CFBP 13720]
MRTSESHPLHIATISAGPGLGRIGLTFCPGKKQASALTGAWGRDVDLDVRTIAMWGAAAVVTLIEPHEFDQLQVEGLGDAIRGQHMDWLHLPIPDVSTPGTAFEAAWSKVGPGLRSRVRAGFDVLVHCKGGLGRAGMIAARLLIDLGLDPVQAITSVRAVRPGAIETSAQEKYVLGLRPLPPVLPNVQSAARRDRAIGALVGLAVGDAVGTTLEFTRRDQMPALTDMVGGGPFSLKPGQWTDDTAMALALADSLISNLTLNEDDLMQRFVCWHREGEYSCTGRCFDIGITTRQALSRFERDGNPVAGATDPYTAGNGSLMRLAPVAIAAWNNAAQRHDLAERQSRTTHGAEEAIDACIAYSDLIAEAVGGLPHDAILTPRACGLAPSVAAVLAGSWQGKARSTIQSSGYVLHSLEAALWCVARTGDFASAVLLAANLGDDADTTAAITGQLAGALYGYEAIPITWRSKLAWHDRLVAAATALHA